jgi:hypothetical protein
MSELQLHLWNDKQSFHSVHPLIRAFGSWVLHHAKGRGLETRTELTAVDSFIALLIESLEADKQRLDTTLNRLLAIASVIPLDKSVVINAAEHRSCFGLQHQDSLVYSSVLHHLQTTPSHQSCFLNRNSKDFDDPDIIESFQALNCKMLFHFDHGLNHVISLLS